MNPAYRLLRVVGVIVAPLGFGAALSAHECLRAIASLHWGAPSFAAHEHTAILPTACIELALALWLLSFAVRDAVRRGVVCYRHDSLVVSGGPFALCSAAIAVLACGTLFSMEFVESGRAACGLGWLGGSLLPGAIVLGASIAAMIGLLAAVVAGRAAGLERLIALFASALSGRAFARRSAGAFIATRVRPRVFARSCPGARHASLRAPPIARS